MKSIFSRAVGLFCTSLLLGCGVGGNDENEPDVKLVPVNKAPIAVNDVVTVYQGQQITIDVLANDTDADTDQLTITTVALIRGGIPSIINNKVLFIAETGFTGVAQFSYTISDGSETANASVNITISLSPADKMAQLKTQVDSFVASTIAAINEQSINCETHPEQPQCELVSVKFSDGQFDASKTDPNQTILILDQGLEFPSMVRYRSRVKAAFIQEQDGFYHQQNKVVTIQSLV